MTDALVLSEVETGRLPVEQAAAWLRECKSVDAVKDLRDRARAIEIYQRERNAGLDAQLDASEIAVRAERRLGEMCHAVLAPGRPKKSSDEPTVSLATLSISKDQSSRWQKLAAVSDEAFEAHVASVRNKGMKLTTAGAIRAVSDEEGYDGDEWYTAEEYVQAAREVMGGIDIDPASNEIAQRVVKAAHYDTKETDGLASEWRGRVWFQPPYSLGLIDAFVEKLHSEISVGRASQVTGLVNNATETKWAQSLLRRFPACFPDHRLSFYRADGVRVRGNRQGQMFFYFGPRIEAFGKRFDELGAVLAPRGSF